MQHHEVVGDLVAHVEIDYPVHEVEAGEGDGEEDPGVLVNVRRGDAHHLLKVLLALYGLHRRRRRGLDHWGWRRRRVHLRRMVTSDEAAVRMIRLGRGRRGTGVRRRGPKVVVVPVPAVTRGRVRVVARGKGTHVLLLLLEVLLQRSSSSSSCGGGRGRGLVHANRLVQIMHVYANLLKMRGREERGGRGRERERKGRVSSAIVVDDDDERERGSDARKAVYISYL